MENEFILKNHSLNLNLLPKGIEYKVLKEFPDYAIGSNGEIYSFKNKKTPKKIKGGLTSRKDKDGKKSEKVCYKTVRLKTPDTPSDKIGVCKTVHRLVCKAFHPNPENKPQVNHIDGVKSNNAANNLEWVTSKENVNHSLQTGLSRPAKGEAKPNAKYTEEMMSKVADDIRKGVTNKTIINKYGLDYRKVNKIRMMKEWKHIWTKEEIEKGPYVANK